MRSRLFGALLVCAATLLAPVAAFAQRTLHWDTLDVAAQLGADGTLHVTETQVMVFTGDWNGGERVFNVRPRQRFAFEGMRRITPGGAIELRESSRPDAVDEYAWAGLNTLRWRSRLPAAPPFANTAIRYELKYALSNVLLKDGDAYRLDHDFAFPDRVGPIQHFTLALTLDPAWHPLSDEPLSVEAGPLAPGRGFVVTLPLRFSGTEAPAALDATRPRAVGWGIAAVFGVTAVALGWFFVRERSYGRFAPLNAAIDETWLQEHVFKYPAEVVAAAWDESIGAPEVVTLIARLVAEGKLQSAVGEGKSPAMTLRLLADRSAFQGYERTFIDKLFFNGRTETSTSDLRAHYHASGFNPAHAITKELEEAVARAIPAGPPPRRFWMIGLGLFVVGVVLIGIGWFQGAPAAFLLTIPVLILAGIAWIAGFSFRTYLALGWNAAWWSVLPAIAMAAGTAAYLWFYSGGRDVAFPPVTIYGIVAFALSCIVSAINALKTREPREKLAFRKALASARAFFQRELQKPEPALRDEWYPWLLAFELGKQADAWSIAPASEPSRRQETWRRDRDRPVSTSNVRWSGFGGGRSGGAGASGSWQAAASGFASSVSPPSSSRSNSGSSSSWSSGSSRSSGSSGGSSSRGSSGGGGGGGW